MDLVINTHPVTNVHYRNGLMDAYKIMSGLKV
jgi:hypothetical protein